MEEASPVSHQDPYEGQPTSECNLFVCDVGVGYIASRVLAAGGYAVVSVYHLQCTLHMFYRVGRPDRRQLSVCRLAPRLGMGLAAGRASLEGS